MAARRFGVAALAVCAAFLMAETPALAGGHGDGHGNGHGRRPHCDRVSGKAVWTLIPSPNDPLGRVLGPATGDLKASVSAYLTSLAPQPDGTLKATSVETWVVGPQDVILFDGVATFTPFGTAGNVKDALTLTVSGGSGDYAGATGSLEVRGIGYNLLGPGAGPGSSFFDVRYSGTICTN